MAMKPVIGSGLGGEHSARVVGVKEAGNVNFSITAAH